MNMEYLFIYLSFWLICATDFYILILFYVLHFYWIYLLILANIFFLVESLKGFYIYVLCRAGHWVHTSEQCNTLLQGKLLSYVEAIGLFKEKAAGTLCSAGNWGPWWYLVWLTLSVLTPLFPSQLQTPQHISPEILWVWLFSIFCSIVLLSSWSFPGPSSFLNCSLIVLLLTEGQRLVSPTLSFWWYHSQMILHDAESALPLRM